VNDIMIDDLTIAAIATPVGNGGVGIIRISGSNALPAALSIFRRPGFSTPSAQDELYKLRNVESHRLYYGYIIDPDIGQIVDEVLLALMKAPRSYTREDVVEIHCHGGSAALNAVLKLVLKQGARIAQPGEFTRRAFLNGRIDLAQAEAVIDVINAKSGRALESAAHLLKGDFSRQIESIRGVLLGMVTQIEAAIDFPDDIDDVFDVTAFISQLQQMVLEPVQTLIGLYDNGHIYREGIKVIIIGRPNVGKSSLMNCLLQKDRVIVTPIPGTTRDFIDDRFSIADISVTVTDTAGLHKTDDPVEAIGIKKVYECIERSDLVLFVIDGGVSFFEEDLHIVSDIKDKPMICVVNKSDLFEEKKPVSLPATLSDVPVAVVSALYDKGINELKTLIHTMLVKNVTDGETSIIPNLRHKTALEHCALSIQSGIDALNAGMPAEIVSIDLREGMDAVAEVLGIRVNEDILDHIFNQFCIGK